LPIFPLMKWCCDVVSVPPVNLCYRVIGVARVFITRTVRGFESRHSGFFRVADEEGQCHRRLTSLGFSVECRCVVTWKQHFCWTTTQIHITKNQSGEMLLSYSRERNAQQLFFLLVLSYLMKLQLCCDRDKTLPRKWFTTIYLSTLLLMMSIETKRW